MDILRHAELGNVEIWTSAITMAEVIRPKNPFTPVALPEWSKSVLEKFPAIEIELRKLWDFFKRRTMPTRQLTDAEATAIQDLFNADWIKIIHLDERTINEAVTMARKYGLKPMDAIHAASAYLKRPPIDEFHYFDKDYSRVSAILKLALPSRISAQEEFKQFIRPITS
jgi:predicted nucleic acid-binding protein